MKYYNKHNKTVLEKVEEKLDQARALLKIAKVIETSDSDDFVRTISCPINDEHALYLIFQDKKILFTHCNRGCDLKMLSDALGIDPEYLSAPLSCYRKKR